MTQFTLLGRVVGAALAAGLKAGLSRTFKVRWSYTLVDAATAAAAGCLILSYYQSTQVDDDQTRWRGPLIAADLRQQLYQDDLDRLSFEFFETSSSAEWQVNLMYLVEEEYVAFVERPLLFISVEDERHAEVVKAAYVALMEAFKAFAVSLD